MALESYRILGSCCGGPLDVQKKMVLSLWDRIYCSSVLLCLHPNLFHAIKANEHSKKKKKKKKMFSVKVASIIKKTESFFLVWHKEASLRTLNRWEVVSTPRKEGLGF